jgi:hypothetical protein
VRLNSQDHAYWNPIWSPDGQFIVYRLDTTYFAMNATTLETQRLNIPFESISGVTWQPVWK